MSKGPKFFGNHMNLGLGNFPAEYNPKVHGPYYPWKWYGAPDKAFRDVKVGELAQWLGRRNYHPFALTRAFGRGLAKWRYNWLSAKQPSMAGFLQVVIGFCVFSYAQFLPETRKSHRHYKYH
ncbi:hypothetical protein CAPTEDRAFT_181814 [Capitella teleta]|uniref:ATP synthase subunit f, mitochondrial n=1 Tax=Capitella teleta TaxID=283909 RepID=R7UWM4_CAPTE|nr:hypothetical protein CAPTEDRAFT_181814 [Capitella teleta]|eukprot:ELU08342.1 hypothetical protein CAPTEDRAFT_181814 [Capitella teleta]